MSLPCEVEANEMQTAAAIHWGRSVGGAFDFGEFLWQLIDRQAPGWMIDGA